MPGPLSSKAEPAPAAEESPSGRCPSSEAGDVRGACGNCPQSDFHDGPKGYARDSNTCYFPWPWGTDGEMGIPQFYSPPGRRKAVDGVIIFAASLFRRIKHLHSLEGRLGHVTWLGPWNEGSIQVCPFHQWGPPPSPLSLCHTPAQAYLQDNAGSL